MACGWTAQGNRIIKGNLGKMGKVIFMLACLEIPRKQGVFVIRPYNRLIVVAGLVFGDIFMSLEKRLEN